MTLYLKYRPQSISELDSKEIRELLDKTLKSENLPHAWLFSGPRGTGKTSTARILAKYVNCQGEKKPCNKCNSCREITAGSSPDVIEIDAASNRGIDEIRDLREKVRLSSMGGKYKIYIIDEVHMLTTEAANALLKTLEEPPKHVMFVLCTTESDKLPDTVVSRCSRIIFKKPKTDEIVEKLEKVVKQEKVSVGAGELEKIAKMAGGSFRDAIKILEQVMLGGKLDEVEGAEEFLEMERDGALAYINKLAERGVNLRAFIEECVEVLREKLLETKDVGIISKIDGLEKAYVRMKDAFLVQLPLEIFVIETTKDTSPRPSPESGEGDEVGRGMVESPRLKLDDVVGKWGEIMAAVRPKNHSVEALLRSTKPAGFDGRDLVLEVYYEFHKKQLETDRCRKIVEDAVSGVMGVEVVTLKLIMGSGVKKKVDDDALIAAAQEIFK